MNKIICNKNKTKHHERKRNDLIQTTSHTLLPSNKQLLDN